MRNLKCVIGQGDETPVAESMIRSFEVHLSTLNVTSYRTAVYIWLWYLKASFCFFYNEG